MAGESPDRIWRDLCQWNNDPPGSVPAGLYQFGASCAAQGCHRCDSPDCTYADFIRKYRSCPHGD